MKYRISLLAIAVVLLAAGTATAQSLDEVLAKAHDARGGLKNIKSVESARMTGTFVIPNMMEASFTMEWKRPDKLRMSFTTPQGDGAQAYDGETAWGEFPGGGGPQEITGAQADSLKQQADLIDGPLVDWKDKGNTVEYVGEGEYEGTPAVKLKLTQANGDETTIFLDAASFLTIHGSGTTKMQGMETDVETYYDDYRKIGDLMMAHSIKNELIDVGMTQILTMDTIELNVAVADDRFAMPAVEAAPEPAAADE